MKVALGFKAHSGWAALVVLGAPQGRLEVLDRRRVELVEEVWARAPYHAAEGLAAEPARQLVTRGIEAAHRVALGRMREAVSLERAAGHEVAACAVLAGSPMPERSVEQVLAVHAWMHHAEGALFRDALSQAASASGLRLVAVPQKLLIEHATRVLGVPASTLNERVARLGKAVGAPWCKDQKEAALAALIALLSE